MEEGNQEFPAYKWYVQFRKVDQAGKPLLIQTWDWKGEAIGITEAINEAMDAMIDAVGKDHLSWRIATVVNLNLSRYDIPFYYGDEKLAPCPFPSTEKLD